MPGKKRKIITGGYEESQGPPSLLDTYQDAGSSDVDPTDPDAEPASTTRINADLFDRVKDVVGPLGFDFGNYGIVPQPGEAPKVVHGPDRLPAGSAARGQGVDPGRQLQHGEPLRGRDGRRRPHLHRRRDRREDDPPRQRDPADAPTRRDLGRGGRLGRVAAGSRRQARRLPGHLGALERRTPRRRRLPRRRRARRHRRPAARQRTRPPRSPAATTTRPTTRSCSSARRWRSD